MPDAPFDPEAILEILEIHRVRYVVIGGFAAVMHGANFVTFDLDVCPHTARQNLARLAAALREIDARLRVTAVEEEAEFPLDDHTFDQLRTATFDTRYGPFDFCLVPDGTRGYDDLRRDATRERLNISLEVPVASLADVIRSKEAAGRDKDRLVLPGLRELLSRSPRHG